MECDAPMLKFTVLEMVTARSSEPVVAIHSDIVGVILKMPHVFINAYILCLIIYYYYYYLFNCNWVVARWQLNVRMIHV
jgi:hypothetical protein